jgi:hypothetical protein
VKAERVLLQKHPILNERWVQDRIADDPSILGLGDLILKDKERIQPRAGRLDLLLQDPDTNHRYEVEIQLGRTDESHIIRTIEYWDVERRRYPQYDHTAVLIAEDVTSRFLNIVGLFNGYIPIVAIQMSALQIGEQITLSFTTVLDQLTLGLVDEDEGDEEVADRAYWENRGSKQTVALADDMLELIHEFAPNVELKYNKFYIGLAQNGQANNFARFRPRKHVLNAEIRLEQTDDIDNQLEEAGVDLMDYDKKWGRYRLRLTKDDAKKHRDLLQSLLKASFESRTE